ncbi:hypothetical protein HBI85_250980 [Parastagonospora nodorum]|nr:hypothetical protein HBI85_250980 [Parastagonospora nodorum]
MTSTHRPLRELEARHSLLNLSVHDLVEERRNYGLPCKLSDLYKAGTSLVMDTLTVTPIKDNDNLLNTIDSHIKLRKLKEHLEVREADALKQVGANVREGENKNHSSLYYSDSNSDTATKKTRIKACARLIKRQRLESEAQLRKASEEEELAKTKKEKREKEAREREARLDSPLDSDDYCSDSSPDINPKDDSEDEEATTAKDLAREQKERLKALLNAKMRDSLSARDTFTLRTRQKCEMPKQKGLILRRWTSTSSHNDNWLELAIDPANSTLCDLSDPLVVRFCIFSDPALENIGIPTNKEVVEMQTDTATALADKLAAVNKLVRLQTFTLKILEHVETIIPEANTPAVHPKATKHYLALSAAQFVIVCSFRKVDKHVFRAYNTISRAILLPSHVTVWGRTVFDEFYNCKSEGTIIAKDSVTGDRIYKMEDAVYREHESSHKYKELISQGAAVAQRDILEKEGLNKLEASRRIIFNRFEMQAIASYPALATLKAAQFKTYSSRKVKRFTLNSVKDLFTNPSKDYFLSIAAEDAAKAANTLPPLKEVRAKILIGSYKPIVQAIIVASMAFAEAITLTEATHVVIIEPQDRQNTQDQFMFRVIVYFNLDSELELKVLGKQDVKTTSRDKLQGGGSTVTDQRIDWHQTEPIVISLEALC